MRLLKAYNFRTKDPAIDEIRTVIEDSFGKRIDKKVLRQIAEDGGPTAACMSGWFFGKTRRPQNPTLEAAGRSMGMKRQWVRMTNREVSDVKKRL